MTYLPLGLKSESSGVSSLTRCQSSIALVGQACAAAAVEPSAPISKDLEELRSTPYLAAFFDERT